MVETGFNFTRADLSEDVPQFRNTSVQSGKLTLAARLYPEVEAEFCFTFLYFGVFRN